MVRKRIKNLNTILKKYIDLLKEEIPIDMILLYGSYARGTPRDWSDIDVVVVSPAFHGGTIDDYLLLSRTARKVTSQIEAIPYRSTDLSSYEHGDFIDEVLRTGKIIYKKSGV